MEAGIRHHLFPMNKKSDDVWKKKNYMKLQYAQSSRWKHSRSFAPAVRTKVLMNTLMDGKTATIMKPILYIVALATLMVACTEDEQLDNILPDNKVRMEFYATADASTRTVLVENNAVNWLAGDKISLFDPSGANNEFSTAEGGSSVTFTGRAAQAGGTYYALYPYDKDSKIVGSIVTTTLPALQSAQGGSFVTMLNPSVAMADAQQNLYFRNVCALVKFTLDSNIHETIVKAVFSGNGGEALAGTLSIDAAASDPTAVADASFGETEVELTGSLASGGTYYFVVAPAVLSKGLTLTLYKSNGYWKRQGTKEVALTTGGMLNLGTLTPDSFTPLSGYEVIDGVYHIYNADGLMAWASQADALTQGVVLENDIDLQDKKWTPIGSSMDTNGYSGDFDGNGRYIHNLSITSDAGNVGFFGALAKGAKVHDVKFSNATVTGNGSSCAGVVAGSSLGMIEDCNVRGSEVSGQYAGTIVGNNSVQVNRCTVVDVVVHADVQGGMSGGIAGVSYGKIEYCTVSGQGLITANGSNSRAGGIVGYSSEESGISTSGRLLKCAVEGATVSGVMAGGIAGENSFGIVAQCVANQVTVTHQSSAASTRLGGVVGYNTRGDVIASYSAYSHIGGQGLSSEAMGGIVGYSNNSSANVYGCYSTHVSLLGTVSGNESGIGTIAGYTTGHVTSCYAVLANDGASVALVGKYSSYAPDHCVEAGSTDYQTLVTGVGNLTADDGSVWEAGKIWDFTASGAPTIVSAYICNPPETQP